MTSEPRTPDPDVVLALRVAEYVFGWEWVREDAEQPDAVPYLAHPKTSEVYYPKNALLYGGWPYGLPEWPRTWAAAGAVVDEMTRRRHFEFELRRAKPRFHLWEASFSRPNPTIGGPNESIAADAHSAPRAICRAALGMFVPADAAV